MSQLIGQVEKWTCEVSCFTESQEVAAAATVTPAKMACRSDFEIFMANELDRLKKTVSGGAGLSSAAGNAIVWNDVVVPFSSFIRLEGMVDCTVVLTGRKMDAGSFLLRIVAGRGRCRHSSAGENGLQE